MKQPAPYEKDWFTMRYFSFFFAAIMAATMLTACSDSDDAKAQTPGTCASTCERGVALACPNEKYKDVPSCVEECEEQTAQCADPAVVAAFLDCAQNTPMECGKNTGTASSPECLEPGLRYFACIEGFTTDD